MNVAQLRDLLESYDDDAIVMIAHQPAWPLAETVAAVCTLDDVADVDDDPEDPDRDNPDADRNVVWIVAGGQRSDPSPYAPDAIFQS